MAQGRTGEHTRSTRTPPSVPPTDSGAGAKQGESRDPQIRKVHEVARSGEGPGRGNDVPVEEGGARHRQK